MGTELLLNLGLCLCSLLYVAVVVAADVKDFVSIDCGSTTSYTDESGFLWTTDEPYVGTGENVALRSAPRVSINQKQLFTVRFFLPDRNKHCYILPASERWAFLIRASFHHGGFQHLTQISFRISIDANIVDTIIVNPKTAAQVEILEYVVTAVSESISFCLLPDEGNAFINSLELRQLGLSTYDDRDPVGASSYLKLLNRENLGVTKTDPVIRYPDDKYDRLWMPLHLNPFKTLVTNSVVEQSTIGEDVPQTVLQTAITLNSTFFLTFRLSQYEWDMSQRVFINFISADIEDDNFTPLMSVSVNDELAHPNVKVDPPFDLTTFNSPSLTLDVPIVNITFIKHVECEVGPVINGLEVFSSRESNPTKTSKYDVEALEAVKESLGLQSWTGDPCIPQPFDWIRCVPGTLGDLEVTEINLASYGLMGIISPQISDLHSLIKVDLRNNSLFGKIPSELSTLSNLVELDVSDNDLSGQIPPDLVTNPDLDLRTTGNPSLCKPSDDCVDLEEDTPGPARKSRRSKGNGGVIGGVFGGLAGALVLIGIGVWYYCRKKRPNLISETSKEVAPGAMTGGETKFREAGAISKKETQRFTLADIDSATWSYQNKIGEGAFGSVYYGRLSNGTGIAVKVNSASFKKGHAEFMNEVSLLSRVRHPNLVSFVGYCEENEQQIRIFEFMGNGNLRDHLYSQDLEALGWLNWKERLEVVLSAAKGLEFLQNDVSARIIHRNVKSSKILLDGNLVAKVADYGISKFERDPNDVVPGSVGGTNGYLDPEYLYLKRLTYKSDVYSFGVILLEILCGRPPIGEDPNGEGVVILVEWTRRHLKNGELDAIVDPTIRGNCDQQSLWKVAEAAMWCLEPKGIHRPDFSQVIRDLETAREYELTSTLPSSTAPAKEREDEAVLLSGFQNSSSDPHPQN